MSQRSIEIAVGLFVVLGLAALLVLALKVSNLASASGGATFSLQADFENIGGLKARAPVTAGGVRIGRVTSIDYDPESYKARVQMAIEKEYEVFPLDSSASIHTAGLLGEQYIALEPGAEEDLLRDGDEISLTQSALVLERLVGQFLFQKSGE